MEKCFKGDSVENGMSGRVLFAKMPSAKYEYMPSYAVRTNASDSRSVRMEQEDKILQAVHILSSVDGFIDTPRLRRSIETWCNAKADEAKQSQDDVLDTFRKRAAVIGFRCGVVFQLLENGSTNTQWALGHGLHKETRASLDFALLIAEYALKYQTELFGAQLLEVAATLSDTGRRTKNKALYDELPDTFTFPMLQSAKPQAKTSALRMMVSLWKRNGLVRATEINTWEKVKDKS